MVGVSPTETKREGDAIGTTSKKRPCSLWALRSRANPSAPLDEHVRDVLDQLDSNKAVFEKLSREFGGTMNDAPFAVLSFIDNNKSRTLVASDGRGDYTAVLEPGHYCVQAFDIKTGNVIHLDSRQQECIDVVLGKDVRLDIMLAEAN
jgi:hypothetical protein